MGLLLKGVEINSFSQLIRFGFVGALSNLVLYFLYLAITSFGMNPLIAMTFLYIFGVMQTYAFNKQWTFSHDGVVAVSMRRYLVAYGIGYLINLSLLYLFVDFLNYPHQIVQGVAIILVAIGLFAAQKYWVFSKGSSIHGG